MRTLVDIPEPDIRALDEVARQRDMSRASLLREAIDTFLAKHRQSHAMNAFGLWGSEGKDGMAYQNRLRAEW